MKKLLWIMTGFFAAGIGFVLWSPPRTPSVQFLAHRLEDAWADHHTIV
ncbi:MAG TPA: hypothetical protein VNU92_09610 [Edaphobacter sp.]|jgi:hypothetical protein|nr:hypothetical protein [Edaphobacter sp.]